MKYPNDNVDQAVNRSGVQTEIWPTDTNLGIVNIYSWLLRVTWN